MNYLIKGFTVFLTCIFFFKFGVPTAIAFYGNNFISFFLVCTAGGVTGNILFTYLSAAILKKIHDYRAKRNLIHKKPIFTKFNRRVIRIKQRFGLYGIAFITPVFLSTPLGAFLAERFFRDKKKIILFLSISTIFWELLFYSIYLLF
jgi:hypothetical protein